MNEPPIHELMRKFDEYRESFERRWRGNFEWSDYDRALLKNLFNLIGDLIIMLYREIEGMSKSIIEIKEEIELLESDIDDLKEKIGDLEFEIDELEG